MLIPPILLGLLLPCVQAVASPFGAQTAAPIRAQPTSPLRDLFARQDPPNPGPGGTIVTNGPNTGVTTGGTVPAQNATATRISVPTGAPAGGLTYTRPAITDAPSYIKIAPGNLVTFGWNYTSLYITPERLTFMAYCSDNKNNYPVGPTTGIPGSETQIVWDPWGYQQEPNATPFAQASYTLSVWDERGRGIPATAGYFYGDSRVVNFAMYSPARYTPLAAGWTCVGCSAGYSAFSDLHPLWTMIPVTIAMILIGGAGVLGR